MSERINIFPYEFAGIVREGIIQGKAEEAARWQDAGAALGGFLYPASAMVAYAHEKGIGRMIGEPVRRRSALETIAPHSAYKAIMYALRLVLGSVLRI